MRSPVNLELHVPNTVENLITSASVAVARDSKENLEQLIKLYCNICVVGEVLTPEKTFPVTYMYTQRARKFLIFAFSL